MLLVHAFDDLLSCTLFRHSFIVFSLLGAEFVINGTGTNKEGETMQQQIARVTGGGQSYSYE